MGRDVTVVTNPRDQFSCIAPFLRQLRGHTPEDVPILAVIGGAPHDLRERWAREHGSRIEFLWVDRFLNETEARRIALPRVETPLAAMIDADCFPRPGWLEALLDCRRATGAACVVPTVLERPRRIHCIGCDFYVVHDGGKRFVHKVLRFHRYPFVDGCNLERRRSDYGELHCMLIEVPLAIEHDVFDPNIREGGDIASGLAYRAAGREVWVEPSAVVHFVDDAPLHAPDVDFYTWRWDMRAVREGYDHLEAKWGLDVSEQGSFRNFLYDRNRRVGPLTRALPGRLTFELEQKLTRAAWKVRRLLRLPDEAWFALRARQLDYAAWPTRPEERLNQAEGHPSLG